MARSIDVGAAVSFVARHGRLLDRRRLDLVLGVEGAAARVLGALEGYRNPGDGGYGWGLEPDLRSRTSQPTAAMHAFEALAEVVATGGSIGGRGVELCDWLERHTLDEGGLPFALPIDDPAGCAPFWVEADPHTSSLQMTAQVAANAHLVGRHERDVARHPWLAAATAWCLDAIDQLEGLPHAYELLFAMRFLDAVAATDEEAARLLARLGALLPPDGVVAVEGGVEGEALRPLDFAPRAGGPARHLFAAALVDGELDRLAARQRSDGGWTVYFESSSPAAALEWRGYATVAAVAMLRER